MFSLRTVIDDILLIVRNNNISESEDLSRDQIAAWVMAYKALLQKKEQDKDKSLYLDKTPSNDQINDNIYKQINGIRDGAFISTLAIPTIIIIVMAIIMIFAWIISIN